MEQLPTNPLRNFEDTDVIAKGTSLENRFSKIKKRLKKRNKKPVSDKQLVLTAVLTQGGATAVARFLFAPIDRLKIIFQLQDAFSNECKGNHPLNLKSYPNSNNVKGAFRAICTLQKFSSFWWGFKPHLWNIIQSNGIRLAAYHRFKYFWFDEQGKMSPNSNFSSWSAYWRTVCCYYAASATAMCFCYPLDVAYTRLAADTGSRDATHKAFYRGVFHSIKANAAGQGIASIYKGFGFCLFSSFPFISIAVATNNLLHMVFASYDAGANSDDYLPNDFSKKFSNTPSLVDFINDIATEQESSKNVNSSTGSLNTPYTNELYASDLTEKLCYDTTSTTQDQGTNQSNFSPLVNVADSNFKFSNTSNSEDLNRLFENSLNLVPRNMCIGFFAGIIAQTLTYPLDTIRRRYQYDGSNALNNGLHNKRYSSIKACAQDCLRGGLKGLYRGCTVNLLKFIPESLLLGGAYLLIQRTIVA